jgi:kynurenine formamidase
LIKLLLKLQASKDSDGQGAKVKLADVQKLNRNLIDVSLPVRAGMFPIGEASNVKLTALANYEKGYYETQLRMSVHAGTHMDYPSHIDTYGQRGFVDNGFQDSIFPEHTFTPAYFLSFDDKQPTELLPSGTQRYGDEITADEIRDWFKTFDETFPAFPHEQVKGALLRTGWYDHWFDDDFWQRGSPTLSDDGASYLVSKGIDYIASDFLFTFPGRTHDIVMKGSNRFQIESLCNLGSLTSQVVGLLIAPLKLQHCEGLPARVYAVNLDLSEYEVKV